MKIYKSNLINNDTLIKVEPTISDGKINIRVFKDDGTVDETLKIDLQEYEGKVVTVVGSNPVPNQYSFYYQTNFEALYSKVNLSESYEFNVARLYIDGTDTVVYLYNTNAEYDSDSVINLEVPDSPLHGGSKEEFFYLCPQAKDIYYQWRNKLKYVGSNIEITKVLAYLEVQNDFLVYIVKKLLDASDDVNLSDVEMSLLNKITNSSVLNYKPLQSLESKLDYKDYVKQVILNYKENK